MATIHTVQQGEHLSRIASRYGFADYRKLWDHPQNRELKAKRQNPNVLYPGDQLFIPEKDAKHESGGVEQRHRFALKRTALKLRVAVEDAARHRLEGARCTLEVEGEQQKVLTGKDGLVESEIPYDAETALLTVEQEGEAPEVLSLQIGHLDPIEEIPGQVERLRSLGYYTGDPEPPDLRELRSAVEEFQCDHGLAVDGVCGPNTQRKLREVHGS